MPHTPAAIALLALALTACSGDKGTESGTPTGTTQPATGTGTGTGTGATATGTGTGTGATGTGTGSGGTGPGTGTGAGTGGTATGTGTGTGTGATATGTGTGTGGTTPPLTPVETLTGCDPSHCSLTAGGGPNGGDLCRCTLDPLDHPLANDADGSCFSVVPTRDLVLHFDLTGLGYTQWAVDTCQVTPGDSVIAVYDADPNATGATEVACHDDASPNDLCAQVGANGASPAIAQAAPVSGQLWVVVDEYGTLTWWNGIDTRTIDIELFR